MSIELKPFLKEAEVAIVGGGLMLTLVDRLWRHRPSRRPARQADGRADRRARQAVDAGQVPVGNDAEASFRHLARSVRRNALLRRRTSGHGDARQSGQGRRSTSAIPKGRVSKAAPLGNGQVERRALLRRMVAAGLRPADFWEETPRSFVNIMEGIAERDRRAIERSSWQAWWMSATSRGEAEAAQAIISTS
jgi:hypothetical protein